MEINEQMWLVRTRGGDFLGPYTEGQLILEVNAGTFSPDDEIAPSGGYWISAQKLVNREDTEFTKTSTRQTNTTRSISVYPSESNAALKESPANQSQAVAPQPIPTLPAEQPTANRSQRPILAILISALFVVSLLFIRLLSTTQTEAPDKPSTNLQTSENTPLVNEVYSMIRSGEREAALVKLTKYHQTPRANDEFSYQIPYAGLLITEGVSNQRATRALEEIVASNAASEGIKSQAHRWLGYMQLAQDSDDRGVSHFLQALLMNPKDTAAKFNLGRAYLKQGLAAKALDYFKLAELEMPDLWLIHIYKGHAKVELKKFNEARFDLKRATEISNERWLTYVYYGLFLAGVLNEPADAQEAMRRMLTRDPYYEINSPPPFGFFFTEENYGDYLEAFLRIMGNKSQRLTEVGRLYIRYLQNGPASREGRRILRLAKNGGIVTRVIALKVLLDNDAPRKALLEALSRLPPALDEFGYYAYVLKGEALLKLGLVDEAGESLKRALLMGPKTAISRLAHAKWLKKTGKDADAADELKSILTYHPNYIPAILSLRNL